MKYPLTGHMWNVAPFNVLELHVLWWCGVCIGSLVFFDERDKASDWINYFSDWYVFKNIMWIAWAHLNDISTDILTCHRGVIQYCD